jgi:hypothetical protein
MTDMVTLTGFLKDRLFDVYIDQAPSAGSILESGFFGSSGASIDKEIYRADQLIQDACAVKITTELLKTYTLEWEEKTRAEKEREAELESLKSLNQALTQKVRRLEERVQEHDSEHAALATELVRTKVENEELNDENESLKGQVRELRLVVEKQPEEVEERLKSEMDRLMKTNQEVHEENSKLEEEMGEMEKELVETKMKYAEVCLLSLLARVFTNQLRSTPNTKLSLGNGTISGKPSIKHPLSPLYVQIHGQNFTTCTVNIFSSPYLRIHQAGLRLCYCNTIWLSETCMLMLRNSKNLISPFLYGSSIPALHWLAGNVCYDLCVSNGRGTDWLC